jgi:hypothetical protein
VAAVVMSVLFVASLVVVPISERREGEPFSLACVGILAAGALRHRTRRPHDDR